MDAKSPGPDTGSESVGELIRQYRLMAGLTQEEVSERSGLSVRAVRNLERDKVQRPRRSTLLRLAAGLDINDIDTARLVAAARRVGLQSEPTSGETHGDGWTLEWLWLKPILGPLIDQVGAERVVLVPVLVHAPPHQHHTCRQQHRAEDWRSQG